MPGHIAPAYVAADANTLSTGSYGEMFEKLLVGPAVLVQGERNLLFSKMLLSHRKTHPFW